MIISCFCINYQVKILAKQITESIMDGLFRDTIGQGAHTRIHINLNMTGI